MFFKRINIEKIEKSRLKSKTQSETKETEKEVNGSKQPKHPGIGFTGILEYARTDNDRGAIFFIPIIKSKHSDNVVRFDNINLGVCNDALSTDEICKSLKNENSTIVKNGIPDAFKVFIIGRLRIYHSFVTLVCKPHNIDIKQFISGNMEGINAASDRDLGKIFDKFGTTSVMDAVELFTTIGVFKAFYRAIDFANGTLAIADKILDKSEEEATTDPDVLRMVDILCSLGEFKCDMKGV